MLEALALLVPRGSKVAALLEIDSPFSRPRHRTEFDRAAKILELNIEVTQVRTPEDVRAAFSAMAQKSPVKLGEIPMGQPTRLSLAVNLQNAQKRGIRLPQEILLRADRIIQ